MADASLRIQQCKRLRKDNLDLSGLGLILIPQEAMSLVGITSLDLSGNKLSSLDARIGDLTNLTELNLEGNNLKYLPQELSNLKKLTHLNLKGNPLDGAFKSLLNADQNSLAGAISSCLRKHKQTLESNDFFDDIGWADDGPRKMTKIKGDDDDFDFDFDTDNSKIPTGGITKVSSEIKTGSKTRTHAASKQQDGGMKVASKTPLARGSRDGPSNKPNRGANDDFGMDDIMDSIATNKSRTNFSLADEDEVKLDELTILGKISQGGFSIVQKGIFRGTDVAIKRIFDPVITDKLREEIDNEVSVLSKIRHPNIVMMMAYSSTSPNLFIVFEMASRGALFDMLHKKKERLDEKLKCRIAYQTALALNYIHLSKVVHRDIKSHNILLDENYTVKLCDFGIARRMSELNRGGSSAGTPNYLSPEQFEQKAIDEKVDVFAFGTLVWELFTEQVPYEGLDVADMRKATCSGKDLPMGLSVPKSIQVLIKKCRELVPGDRPSLTEVCKELQALLN